MLDEYWFGDTARISPEAPVPVVRTRSAEQRPGGAANVALNVAALGARSVLAAVVGRDERGDQLGAVRSSNAACAASSCARPELPTIHKLRVFARSQQLLRIDAEQSLQSCADEFGAMFAKLLPQAHAVVSVRLRERHALPRRRAHRAGARSRHSRARRPEGHGLRALSRRVRADAESRRVRGRRRAVCRRSRSAAQGRGAARGARARAAARHARRAGHDAVRARRGAADAADAGARSVRRHGRRRHGHRAARRRYRCGLGAGRCRGARESRRRHRRRQDRRRDGEPRRSCSARCTRKAAAGAGSSTCRSSWRSSPKRKRAASASC